MGPSMKVRFLFATEASADDKTTVCRVQQVLQRLTFLRRINENIGGDERKKILIVRNAYRNPTITLIYESRHIYLDEEGHPFFRGDLLEEIDETVRPR